MINFLTIFKNNIHRSIEKKNYIIATVLMISVAILLAVYFTSKLEIKGNIAVVTDNNKFNINSKYVKVTVVDKIPSTSELVMNRYDAVLIDKGNNRFDIDTVKSDEFKKELEEFIRNPKATGFKKDEDRGVGSNILGYLIMFVLLQGLMFMTLYSDDKENKMFKRIATSPVSIGTYLFTHSVFNYLLVFIPTFTVLVVCREVLNINIGFSYFQYIWLLGILTLLSTAFALFMCSIIDKGDNSMTMGSSIVTLSSILAGSFYSFRNDNAIMKNIIGIFPQKNYLKLVQGLEHGKALSDLLPQLTYLLTISMLMFVIAVIVAKKKFKSGC
ncbi:MAG: ABC transporter permease [Bacillota bacterium]|nr:ABC transporter permease [Bacillota bacterium]